MKRVAILVSIFAVLVCVLVNCGDDCAIDGVNGANCIAPCGPNDQACATNCVETYYCSDWDSFCGFGYSYWGCY